MEDTQKGMACSVIFMTRKAIFMLSKESTDDKFDKRVSHMENKLQEMTKCPQSQLNILSQDLKHFKCDLKKKWRAANYIEERFINKNENWLNTSIQIYTWEAVKPGRPTKNFEELCDRSKRRKTKDLREQVAPEALTYAASCSQRISGNVDAAKLMKKIISSPTRAGKLRRAIKKGKQTTEVKQLSPAEALQLYIEADLTKRQYKVLQKANKRHYPCYSRIKEAKKVCYPPNESMTFTETCAEADLQALLDHTLQRLCAYLGPVMNEIDEKERKNLNIIIKWGCDGSQQIQFKQKFENVEESDANIFQSSLVPIRLVCGDNIIWNNPSPGSVWLCRPIRIRFTKETKEVTNQEIQFIEEQCANLRPTKIAMGNIYFEIKHTLLPTMVDAKVCNAATDTSSTMWCYICGQTSKDFNKLIKKEDFNKESLRFGLSTLHARIRFFESLLHIAYKLPLKKWQIRGKELQAIVNETKADIHKKFKEKLGLRVDVPKQGGGNSNDGNTSRRVFSDPETAADIMKLDVTLIKRLAVVLEVISCGFEVDEDKFENYAMETAQLYVNIYGWHPMTPTLHKVLIHGSVIISHAIVPIGQLSEEAGEARNKHFRKYRTDFARKFSRTDCIRDVFFRLLLTSDPYVSLNRKRDTRKRKALSGEALKLLKEFQVLSGRNHEDSDETHVDEEDSDDE